MLHSECLYVAIIQEDGECGTTILLSMSIAARCLSRVLHCSLGHSIDISQFLYVEVFSTARDKVNSRFLRSSSLSHRLSRFAIQKLPLCIVISIRIIAAVDGF